MSEGSEQILLKITRAIETGLVSECKSVSSCVCFGVSWEMTFDGRQPLMEDTLRWKIAFDGRQPLTADDL